MSLIAVATIAQMYINASARNVTYKRRATVTLNHVTGAMTPSYTEETITVLDTARMESPDDRRVLTGERSYQCLAGTDQDVDGTSVYALSVAPAEGDQLTDGSVTFAVVAWNLENDDLEYRLTVKRV